MRTWSEGLSASEHKDALDAWQRFVLLLLLRYPLAGQPRFVGAPGPCGACTHRYPPGMPSHVPPQWRLCPRCVVEKSADVALGQWLDRNPRHPVEGGDGFDLARRALERTARRLSTGAHQAGRKAS